MTRKLLFFIFFICYAGVAFAQTDFRPGYIIELSGDTIHGMIDYRGDILMSNHCKFRNPDMEIKAYNPNDIHSFKFYDGKYYISKEIGIKKAFLEYLVKGQLNIYYMREPGGEHYFIDKPGEPLEEIPYEEGIKYIDNKEYAVASTRHLGLLKYYVKDAPELSEQVLNIKKPDHRNLIKLAENYHNSVCDDEKCIVYEREIPFLKILPEINAGPAIIPWLSNTEYTFLLSSGLIGHIWMPRNNEKMYLRTGISLLLMNDDAGTNLIMYKFPLQLEYIYPRGFFRPSIAFGPSFCLPNVPTMTATLGLNFKISDHFFVNLTGDADFYPFLLIVPGEIKVYSFNLGVLYNL